MVSRGGHALLLAALFCVGCDDDPNGGTSLGGGGDGGGGGLGGAGEDPCPPPNRMVGGICLEPGVDDAGCAAGTLAQSDGTCLPAGVPATACGPGFEHDGDVGCLPILPSEVCEKTSNDDPRMAVPGDAACRPIGDCGTGIWGNIPGDGNTIYVSESYPGNDSDGTIDKPYTELDPAISAASAGGLIAIAAGGYFIESFISKPLTIRGVCADEVLVIQNPFGFTAGAFDLSANASGTTIRDLAIGSSSLAIDVSGATNVTVDRVYVRNNGGGLQITNAGDVAVTGSLFEDNGRANIFVFGATVTVDRSVLRRGTPTGPQAIGAGIWTQPDDGLVPSSAIVRGSLLEENVFFGAYTIGSTFVLEDSVVRNTQPNPNGLAGRAVTANRSLDGSLRASVMVRRSTLDGNHEASVFAAGSDLVIEDTVVRDTQVSVSSPDPRAVGVVVQPTALSGSDVGSTLVLRRSVVEAVPGTGVMASGSDMTIEGVVIRDIDPDALGFGGRGLYCRADHYTGDPCQATVSGSVIEGTHEIGFFVAGSEATVTTTLVGGILADANGRARGVSIGRSDDGTLGSDVTFDACVIEDTTNHGLYLQGSSATVQNTAIRRIEAGAAGAVGRCLGAQGDPPTSIQAALIMSNSSCVDAREVGLFLTGSTFELDRVLVSGVQASPQFDRGRALEIQSSGGLLAEGVVTDARFRDNVEFGVAVFGAKVTLDRCVVERTTANGAGLFGDGIAVWTNETVADVTVSDSVVRDNARGGLAGFGGLLAVAGTTFSCNGIDLVDGSGEAAVSFEDGGNNACGCPATQESCKQQSSTLEPPSPVDDATEDGDDVEPLD